VILSGKTVTVLFADGRRETVSISNSDELRFEQREKISLTKTISDGGAVPLWVAAGIVHWRLLRSEVADIPADLDEFIDSLDPDDWLEVVEEGKAPGSAPVPSTG
jgi:hypothetical protein